MADTQAALCAAMAAAFKEIEGATKSANNPHFKSKYADLGSVIDAIKPALINHGLFFMQHSRPGDGGVCVETVLYHTGGGMISLGVLFVPANKNDAQAFGSALTYCRRYALMTAFGVPAEDDDGNAAVASGNARPAARHDPVPSKITAQQRAALQSLLADASASEEAFCEYLKVPALSDLAAERFEEAEAALKQRLARMKAPRRAHGQLETVGDILDDSIPY